MTKIFCDLCNSEVLDVIKLKNVVYATHPHNGSDITKNVDCCFDCLKRISNKLNGIEIESVEFDYLEKMVKNNFEVS